MAIYSANAAQKSKHFIDTITADINRGKAIREGMVPVDPITTPIEVSLPMSSKKATSYVKQQAFPDKLIKMAIAAYKVHGKRVKIVIADTNNIAHHKSAGDVVVTEEGRTFTPGEIQNSNEHYATCLNNLACAHDSYEGSMQEVWEAGATVFALDKVMREYGGRWGELDSAVDAQEADPNYDFTIYSNSWGADVQGAEQVASVSRRCPKMIAAFERWDKEQGPVAHFWAAGNAGKAGDGPLTDKEGFPARLDYPISVGALNGSAGWAEFSSPGDGVNFAVGGHDTLSVGKNGVPVIWSGTSSSCPTMAGLAALMFLIDPERFNTQDAIRAGLKAASMDVASLPATAGRDNYTGEGLPQLLNLFEIEDEQAPQDKPEPVKEQPHGPRLVHFHMADALVEPLNKAEGKKLAKGLPASCNVTGMATIQDKE